MTRKMKTLIIIIIILIILIILGICSVLYFKTDMFKSNETLFIKYFMQNFSVGQKIKTQTTSQITDILEQKKYTSIINSNIEYIENISTSDENKNNKINNINLKIESQNDKANNYQYKNIILRKEDKKISGIEYYNENEIEAIRINGIKQFISIENTNFDELLKDTNITNLNILFEDINIFNLITFSEEEKEQLLNTYFEIIKSNIKSDKYKKKANSMITINNQNINTNEYSVTLTKEEYNNVLIKILEQTTKDEIILSKIDNIELNIKQITKIDNEKNYKEIFIEYIQNKIKEIKDNNIGQDQVIIKVYENNGNLIKTSIEKTDKKIELDINNLIRLNIIEINDGIQSEDILEIQNQEENLQTNIIVNYKKINNGLYINEAQIIYSEKIDNNRIQKHIQTTLSNEKYKSTLIINDDITIVDELQKNTDFEDYNIKLDDFSEGQKQNILRLVNEVIKSQLNEINGQITIDDYKKMFQNLNILKKDTVKITNEPILTETQKNRFNAQFQFFESQNLNKENIAELLETLKNNFNDMSVILKSGEIQGLDEEKINIDNKEYIDNISEIVISVKQNTNNEEKQKQITTFIEKNNDKKYSIILNYDEYGLIEYIRIKIQ